MDVVLQQFLREQRPVLRGLVEQGALVVNSYFAQLDPAARGQLCDQYTDLIIHSVLQGYTAREQLQALIDELAVIGILTSELLAQATQIYDDLDNYVRRELAGEPETRDILLRRLQQAYGSMVPKLTANLLDQQYPSTGGGYSAWPPISAPGVSRFPRRAALG